MLAAARGAADELMNKVFLMAARGMRVEAEMEECKHEHDGSRRRRGGGGEGVAHHY